MATKCSVLGVAFAALVMISGCTRLNSSYCAGSSTCPSDHPICDTDRHLCVVSLPVPRDASAIVDSPIVDSSAAIDARIVDAHVSPDLTFQCASAQDCSAATPICGTDHKCHTCGSDGECLARGGGTPICVPSDAGAL